jgi:hypothetical protein
LKRTNAVVGDYPPRDLDHLANPKPSSPRWTRRARAFNLGRMYGLEHRLCIALAVLTLAAPACGNNTSAAGQTDASTDHPTTRTDGNPAPADASGGAAAACTTLVWLFGGCTTAALGECAREYATFPAAMQSDVATYAACLRTMAMGLPDGAVTTGNDAGCPTSSNNLNRWYQHGGCEGNAGQVSHDLGAFDPCTGTAVSCTTLTAEADCNGRYGVCVWSAGACTDLITLQQSCSASAGQCALVPGCVGTGFPSCGGAGQPECFFSQMLPGSAA